MEGPQQFVIFFYYTISTLSTVGYGDYFPRHTNEKLVIALSMMLLIAIYSYNMNILMEVFADYKKI
jgi:hypothetical protein